MQANEEQNWHRKIKSVILMKNPEVNLSKNEKEIEERMKIIWYNDWNENKKDRSEDNFLELRKF